jgi:hypothetical protein
MPLASQPRCSVGAEEAGAEEETASAAAAPPEDAAPGLAADVEQHAEDDGTRMDAADRWPARDAAAHAADEAAWETPRVSPEDGQHRGRTSAPAQASRAIAEDAALLNRWRVRTPHT